MATDCVGSCTAAFCGEGTHAAPTSARQEYQDGES